MKKFGGCFLYHRDFPKGKIFYDLPSVEKALSEDWVEAPQAIKPAPEPPPEPPKPDPEPPLEPPKPDPEPPPEPKPTEVKPRKPRGPRKGKR